MFPDSLRTSSTYMPMEVDPVYSGPNKRSSERESCSSAGASVATTAFGRPANVQRLINAGVKLEEIETMQRQMQAIQRAFQEALREFYQAFEGQENLCPAMALNLVRNPHTGDVFNETRRGYERQEIVPGLQGGVQVLRVTDYYPSWKEKLHIIATPCLLEDFPAETLRELIVHETQVMENRERPPMHVQVALAAWVKLSEDDRDGVFKIGALRHRIGSYSTTERFSLEDPNAIGTEEGDRTKKNFVDPNQMAE